MSAAAMAPHPRAGVPAVASMVGRMPLGAVTRTSTATMLKRSGRSGDNDSEKASARSAMPPVTQHVFSETRPAELYEYEFQFCNFHGGNEGLSVPDEGLAGQRTITPALRAYEIDVLIALHSRMRYHTETLFEAVRMVDVYLGRKELHKEKLRLLTFAALMLAGKHEETMQPSVVWLAREGGKFRPSELRRMESDLFAAMGFRLGFTLPPHFFKRFLRAVVADQTVVDICYYIAEASLTNAALVCELPSRFAAACTYLAVCLVRGPAEWDAGADELIGVPSSEYRPLAQAMLEWLRSIPYREYCRHIVAKYSIEDRSKASLRRLPATLPT